MKFNYDWSICPYIIYWKKGPSRCWYVVYRVGEGRGGDGFLRSKTRQHLLKIWPFRNSDYFFGQTDRPTDRHCGS